MYFPCGRVGVPVKIVVAAVTAKRVFVAVAVPMKRPIVVAYRSVNYGVRDNFLDVHPLSHYFASIIF